jgi:hypothetical protein
MSVLTTARRMANSLIREATSHNVSLKGLTYDNFHTFLDKAFKDGGEVRCEKFTDLAWPYAITNTTFASTAFEDKCHDCIKSAIEIINQEYRSDEHGMAEEE